jgi:hypothetical protein
VSDSKWIFEEIAKGREEAYFRQKEAELTAQSRCVFVVPKDKHCIFERLYKIPFDTTHWA